MIERLTKLERPIIKQWKCAYCEGQVDLADLAEINTWCRNYARQSPPNDTENVLERFCIGVYQLTYIPTLFNINNAREWSESVFSALIHIIGALELAGVDCYPYAIPMIRSGVKTFSAGAAYDIVLRYIPKVMRQIYYYEKGRKNRFDIYELSRDGVALVEGLYTLNYAGGHSLEYWDGFALAMDKLQAIELNTH